MQKPLLIVGIDPGTTVGYALLDLKGSIVNISSSRHTDISGLRAGVPLKDGHILGCSG